MSGNNNPSTVKDVSVVGIVGAMIAAWLNSDLCSYGKDVKEILILGVPLVSVVLANILSFLSRLLDELTAKARIFAAKRRIQKSMEDDNTSDEAKRELQKMYDSYVQIESEPRTTLLVKGGPHGN